MHMAAKLEALNKGAHNFIIVALDDAILLFYFCISLLNQLQRLTLRLVQLRDFNFQPLQTAILSDLHQQQKTSDQCTKPNKAIIIQLKT